MTSRLQRQALHAHSDWVKTKSKHLQITPDPQEFFWRGGNWAIDEVLRIIKEYENTDAHLPTLIERIRQNDFK